MRGLPALGALVVLALAAACDQMAAGPNWPAGDGAPASPSPGATCTLPGWNQTLAVFTQLGTPVETRVRDSGRVSTGASCEALYGSGSVLKRIAATRDDLTSPEAARLLFRRVSSIPGAHPHPNGGEQDDVAVGDPGAAAGILDWYALRGNHVFSLRVEVRRIGAVPAASYESLAGEAVGRLLDAAERGNRA